MNSKKLSNIELYYSPASLRETNRIRVQGEESIHILKVMRHKIDDEIYITDGIGSIFKTIIKKSDKDYIEAQIIDEYKTVNQLKNIFFCIPKLKSSDRFETALEKCTELGITNFIVYDSERTIHKGNKTQRWQKILTSAMKQSLRSFLPDILIVNSLKEIEAKKGGKIIFSQEADQTFQKAQINSNSDYYFIFGPEGDFTNDEKNLFTAGEFYNLGICRLRSETAIIKCASLL